MFVFSKTPTNKCYLVNKNERNLYLIYPSTRLSRPSNPPIHQSIHSSTHASTHPCIYSPTYLSVCPSIYPSIHEQISIIVNLLPYIHHVRPLSTLIQLPCFPGITSVHLLDWVPPDVTLLQAPYSIVYPTVVSENILH